GTVLAAEAKGDVVGMAYAEVRVPSRFPDEGALERSGVVVRSGHRGRGVGRELVAEAARFAREKAVRFIELKSFSPNQSSMAFWRALGFNPRVVQLVASTDEAIRRLGGD